MAFSFLKRREKVLRFGSSVILSILLATSLYIVEKIIYIDMDYLIPPLVLVVCLQHFNGTTEGARSDQSAARVTLSKARCVATLSAGLISAAFLFYLVQIRYVLYELSVLDALCAALGTVIACAIYSICSSGNSYKKYLLYCFEVLLVFTVILLTENVIWYTELLMYVMMTMIFTTVPLLFLVSHDVCLANSVVSDGIMPLEYAIITFFLVGAGCFTLFQVVIYSFVPQFADNSYYA